MEDSTGKPLTPFFEPRSVALIGASATPGKPGHEAIRNILANGYAGTLYLVNPKGGEILGIPVTTAVSSLPERVDLAVVILPAEATPKALRDCVAKGIRHVVLMAGGFSEVDEAGAQIEEELRGIIRESGIRVLGPNTSGHTSTPCAFTSAFFPLGRIRRGSVSVIAQTGNFATHTMKSILSGEHFGVCRVVGLGNKVDVDEADALHFLADDPETKAILVYLESFKRPRRFLEVARALTLRKPVVMLKSGTSEAGKQAAVAHTAALGTEDRLVDGMLRQAGVVRVSEYSHLLLAAKALSFLPLPRGNRISFLAPSGAMLVVLTDLCTRLGLEVPPVSPETVQRLQEISPPYIRMRNPVDIWAVAAVKGVEFGYGQGMEAVLRDSHIDAVVPVLMLTREMGVPPFDFILDLVKKYPEKPVLVSFSGEKECIEECKAFLEPRGVPTFPEIEQPFEALSILIRCSEAMNRTRAAETGRGTDPPSQRR
jgi:acyl-CoA synthetase (NDP forming)